MGDESAVTELVESAIRRICGIASDDPLPPDVPLTELGMDSLRTAELVIVLEDDLDLVFPEEYLTVDTFATAHSVLAAVRTLAV